MKNTILKQVIYPGDLIRLITTSCIYHTNNHCLDEIGNIRETCLVLSSVVRDFNELVFLVYVLSSLGIGWVQVALSDEIISRA